MRRMWFVLLMIGSIAALPSRVTAAALSFAGEIEVRIGTIDPFVVPGSGIAIVNGSASAGHLTRLEIPPDRFDVSGLTLGVTNPIFLPIEGLQLTARNGEGDFTGSGGSGFGGSMPVFGMAKVCLFDPCNARPIGNLTVPLSVVGAGGAAFRGGLIGAAPYAVTVVGAPWTTGTVSVGTLSAMGGASPTSATGAASGRVTLVTPIFISTSLLGSSGPALAALATMRLHFVPEPGTLALLGLGLSGCVALHRRTSARASGD